MRAALKALAVALSLLATFAVSVQAQNCTDALSPIFIVPGLTASSLQGTYKISNSTRRQTGAPMSSAAAAVTVTDTDPATDDSDIFAAMAAASESMSQSNSDDNALLTKTYNRTDIAQLRHVAKVLAQQARNRSRQARTIGNNSVGAQWLWDNPCTEADAEDMMQLWLPEVRFLLYPSCFFHMMQVLYNNKTGRFANNTGARVVPNLGGKSGFNYPLNDWTGYVDLAQFIQKKFGHVPGKTLFQLPYDWRYDLTAMNQTGTFERLAGQISKAVANNCGKKAIIIGHSMGTIVSLGLMQDPKFESWRQQNVKGFIALAPPYGGATAAPAVRISGSHGDEFSGSIINNLMGFVARDILYEAAKGMPGGVMLFPTAGAFTKDMVVASTPQRNFTVGQMPQLLAALGDQQSVAFFNQVSGLDKLTSKGAIPNVNTYCIYSTNINTTLSWKFDNIRPNKRTAEGTPVVMGKGDGTVNIESLRMCKRITAASKVVELGGSVTHTSIVSDAAAQAKIGEALAAILAN